MGHKHLPVRHGKRTALAMLAARVALGACGVLTALPALPQAQTYQIGRASCRERVCT